MSEPPRLWVTVEYENGRSGGLRSMTLPNLRSLAESLRSRPEGVEVQDPHFGLSRATRVSGFCDGALPWRTDGGDS